MLKILKNIRQITGSEGGEKEMANGAMEPKHLAARMGISPKRLRAMLRAEHPRVAEVKGRKWEISPELAKEVQKAYKEKKAAKVAAKKAEIKKELGEE